MVLVPHTWWANRLRGVTIVIAIVAFITLTGCVTQPIPGHPVSSSAETYPGRVWQKVDRPETLGWSPELLAKAQMRSKEIGSAAVMVIRHGVVIAEWGETARKFNCHSIRKSLLSALIGIHVQNGNIDLSQTLAEVGIDDNESSLTDPEKQATIGDLIRARSGIYHAALYETPGMTARKPARGSHEPGTFWHYNNWDFNTLGSIFERQAGATIYEEFKRLIADPLHMEDFDITDVSYVGGTKSIHPAYPFRMTARDLARFGLLFLREGRWRNQQVIPTAWVKKSTIAYSDAGPGRGYGYMWWTGRGWGAFPRVKLKDHSYWGAGFGGHWVVVLPYADMVVVNRVDTDKYGDRVSRREMGSLLRLILAAAGEMDLEKEPPRRPQSGDFSNVPLPDNLEIVTPADDVNAELAVFSGKWVGVWRSGRNHILVVEKIRSDIATTIYAYSGRNSRNPARGGWIRMLARFVVGGLRLNFSSTRSVVYRPLPDGTLSATYESEDDTQTIGLKRLE